MGSSSSKKVGEFTKTKICEVEWKIPDFVLLMAKEDVYKSRSFQFAETKWRMSIDNRADVLYVALIKEFSTATINPEVSIGLKLLNEETGQECAQLAKIKESECFYICLKKKESLKRKLYLHPSCTFTVLYTLKLQEATECAGSTKTSKCPFCKGVFDVEDILSHECMNKTIKCSTCSDVIVLKNFQKHECQKGRAEGSTKTSMCLFCKAFFDDKDILSHKCMNNIIKCSTCSDVIVLKNLHEHECKKGSAEGKTASSKQK